MNHENRVEAGLVGRAHELARTAGIPGVRPGVGVELTDEERRAWAQWDADYQAGATPELRAYRTAVEAVTAHHDRRAVRWLEVYEHEQAQRRLDLLTEIDELDREISARKAELTKDAAA